MHRQTWRRSAIPSMGFEDLIKAWASSNPPCGEPVAIHAVPDDDGFVRLHAAAAISDSGRGDAALTSDAVVSRPLRRGRAVKPSALQLRFSRIVRQDADGLPPLPPRAGKQLAQIGYRRRRDIQGPLVRSTRTRWRRTRSGERPSQRRSCAINARSIDCQLITEPLSNTRHLASTASTFRSRFRSV